MALFSFVQSINTTLGTSVFEQVAALIAKPNFRQSIAQYKEFNDTIYDSAYPVIQDILNRLRSSQSKPDQSAETKRIAQAAQTGKLISIKRPRIDLFLEDNMGVEYYFDLKTAKPNLRGFIDFKRQIMEWTAIRTAADPNAKVRSMLAIPYNPYEPKPYDRWTFQGLFDSSNEILVADEFWNFLGGAGTYKELLNVFEEVGMALRPEIDTRFKQFRNSP